MKVEFLKNLVSESIKYDTIPQFAAQDEFAGIQALVYDGLQLSRGKTKVFAYLGLPAARQGLVPAVLLVHGYGGHPFLPWIKMWNARGYAALAMDVTGYFPRRINSGSTEGDSQNWRHGPYGLFEESGYCAGPDNDLMDITGREARDHWIAYALAAVLKGHAVLKQMMEIDFRHIGIMGISWGGVITALALGYDPELAFAVAVYGSGFLSETMTEFSEMFSSEAAKKYWVAEEYFHDVQIPVLWQCWNDDCNFSLNANCKSYEATKKNNNRSALSIIDQMYHSHTHAWRRKEAFLFADEIVFGSVKTPRFFDEVTQESAIIDLGNAVKIQNARVMYITTDYTYAQIPKYTASDRWFMKGDWKNVPCTVRKDCVHYHLPPDAVWWYIELTAVYSSKEEFTVCTPMMRKTGSLLAH